MGPSTADPEVFLELFERRRHVPVGRPLTEERHVGGWVLQRRSGMGAALAGEAVPSPLMSAPCQGGTESAEGPALPFVAGISSGISPWSSRATTRPSGTPLTE